MSNDQSNIKADGTQETVMASPAPAIPHSILQPPQTSTSLTNFGPRYWGPVPSFQVPQGLPGPPRLPGPPGLAPVSSSNMNVPSPFVNSSSPYATPMGSNASISSIPAIQPRPYPAYSSGPPMVATPQGLWVQPQTMGVLSRPPLLQCPPAVSGPFPLSAQGMQLPYVPLPDSQPPGVTPVGPPGGSFVYPTTSGNQSAVFSVPEPELPPGTSNDKPVIDASVRVGPPAGEQLDAWTAHKTETGAVYYYNAVTGESTYEKPAGFKGEAERVATQPTPISWERLGTTDWTLVTTNDGKRYYYNTKTKLSSWQVPTEVTELKKKQDLDATKEQPTSVPNAVAVTEKESAPIILSAPAVNTGGRDAAPLRSPNVPGASSALDMVKRKLQDSGTPATPTPVSSVTGTVASELNGSRTLENAGNGTQVEIHKDKHKDDNGDDPMSDSSSDSEDVDTRPSKEECIIQFKAMLKERGVAPFSKWEKELPKIVFDPRFKAIAGYSARRSLFEHYVRTRAEEERKEKRAAQKAAVEAFKQLLEEAKKDIDHNTDHHAFKKKWGHDPRFEALDRKERENLLNERVLPLKKEAQAKDQAMRAAAASNFKSMLRDRGDITASSRWSKVKDSIRNEQWYKSVKHEDREVLFNEFISDLKSAEQEAERIVKAKRDEEEKLKEIERQTRKRKEREEQEVERVRSKARRKEAVESYQALLVETIKDAQASWTESKLKLEKDPQGRATKYHLDQSDLEKLFREHVKMLNERCTRDFRALLAEVITAEAAMKERDDGKTVFTSWSTAKHLLKADVRYTKMPRKERESLWRRHVDDMQRRLKLSLNEQTEKHSLEAKNHPAVEAGKHHSGSRRNHEKR
ncbi:pre-mRNA-processing protein 40C [Daucus carota subsp. sativus]|nr:PREDICTED: pre-mRNA-processing protein 40C [Daucus carota subsp. sativus]